MNQDKLILEAWIKINKITVFALDGKPHYTDNGGYVKSLPTIDFPLMHELIRGLGEKQSDEFLLALKKVLEMPDCLDVMLQGEYEVALLTAPLIHLKTAYCTAKGME